MKLLITGSNGLLGQKIVGHCKKRNIPYLATSKGSNRNSNCPEENYKELDISDESEVIEVINSFSPTHVIHTAAITNVDYCELNPEECNKTNTEAVQILFNTCAQLDIHFQLLSTDFVFDGEKGNYNEEDRVGPLSVYARSKVNAENVLLKSDFKNWSVLRTIIVYGSAENLSRNNIVYWAKDALMKGDPMNIVDDQYRAPTWADDLAWACIRVCELNQTGIFHISGPETMSIYEIVERIARHFNLENSQLTRVSSKQLNQPAARPPKTGFDLTKARNLLGYNPKTLEETLDIL